MKRISPTGARTSTSKHGRPPPLARSLAGAILALAQEGWPKRVGLVQLARPAWRRVPPVDGLLEPGVVGAVGEAGLIVQGHAGGVVIVEEHEGAPAGHKATHNFDVLAAARKLVEGVAHLRVAGA
eukprot:scaffold18897_cov90-Isochrysis_galbana.AAC.1